MKKYLDSLIVISVAVGMTLACGAWLYKPGQREVATLLVSAQAMRDQIARGTATVSGLASVRSDVRNANDVLTEYATMITPTADVGSFIEEVSAAASELGLRNRAIIPQTPEGCGTIVMLPIEISFESVFAKSFDFLRTIERLPRAVQIASFSIKRANGTTDPDPGEEATLRTKLTLRIFYEAT